MTNPTWVGSTVIDPDDSWSLSWTVTTTDLPAGTQSGDLLLLWLIADTASGSSTFAPTGGWGLSGDWTLVRNQRAGSSTQGYVGCFRSTYVSGALPQTLVPKSSTGTTIDRSSMSGANWFGILMAYRPSSTFSADGGYSSTLAATTVYGGSGATEVFPDGVAGGTTVGVAATTGAAPTLSTTADFTEQTSGASVDWRSGVSCVGYIESATLGNYIWVGGTDVLKFDPATLEPVAFYDGTITNTFFDLTFDGQSSPGLWFSNTTNVRKLDLSSGTFSSPVTVGSGPRPMTFGAGSVWVGHINDNTIKRIDPATETVTETITLAAGRNADSDAIFAAGYAWFCDYGSGRVFKVDPATNTATDINIGTNFTTGLGYDGTDVWAVSSSTRAIYTINTSTNAVTKQTADNYLGTVTTGELAWDGAYMWVRVGTDVKRIDPATYTIAATVAVSGDANDQMAYMLGYLYVGDNNANVVRKIDVATDTVVATYDTDLAKVRGGYSHIDREFVSAYSGTKPQWTKTTTSYGAAVFAAFGPADQWGVGMVRW